MFPNGAKRVGFFSQNEFQGPLATVNDYDEWLAQQSPEIRNAMPPEFRDETQAHFQELEDLMRSSVASAANQRTTFLSQQAPEREDLPEAQAFNEENVGFNQPPQ